LFKFSVILNFLLAAYEDVLNNKRSSVELKAKIQIEDANVFQFESKKPVTVQ